MDYNNYNRGYAEPAMTSADYMSRTYRWMACGLLVTFAAAFVTATTPLLYVVNSLYLLFTIAELALVFVLSSRVQNMSVGAARGVFLVYALLNGMVLSYYFIAFSVSTLVLAFLALSAFYTDMYTSIAAHPVIYAALIVAVVGLVASRLALANGAMWTAWFMSSLFILGLTFFGAGSMFPSLIISSIDPSFSVTLANGSSSPLTLKIMLAVALTAVPVVILYQAWVYYTFSHKITAKELESEHAY